MMRHLDYPLWSAINFLAVILPAPWHWRSRNVSTICLIGWLTVYSVVCFINSLVWANSYADVAPVWCDISKLRYCLLYRRSSNVL